MSNASRLLAGRFVAVARLAFRSPWFWLIAGAFVLYVVLSLRATQQPGLYMDAVNPDYLVVQMANPNSPTAMYVLPGNMLLGRLPVLGGLYHGSYTVYEAFPFYALLGGTMLSIRIAHLFLGLLVLLAVGLLVRETTRSLAVTGVTLLVLAIDPAFVFLFRTQAYLTAFPVCLTLFALYVIHRYPAARGYLAAGVLLGLSAFGYFVYLFVIPGVLLFALRDPAAVQRRGFLLRLVGGIVLGLLPYALGYGLIFGALGFQSGFASIQGLVHGLSINSGQSYAERGLSVLQEAWLVVTGEWEWVAFWGLFHVDYGQVLKGIALLGLPLSVIAFLPRPYVLDRAFALVGLATVSFIAFATIFGARLGGHDLAAVLPLLYVLAAISASMLMGRLAGRFSARRVAEVALAGCTLLCVLNATATGAVITKLSAQGGSEYYSDVISLYPESVAARHDRTPYVFWDWGAMMPFIYLTGGSVPVFDGSQLQEVLCKYGEANLVFVGDDALNPSAIPPGVRQEHAEILRDAHSGFPYKVVTVSPSGRRCALARLPRGMHLPRGVDEAAFASTQGVYPGVAPTCCFLSDHAAFKVRAGANARWLTLDVFVPSYSFYKPQRLTVHIDGKFATRTNVLKNGMNAVNVPLPATRASSNSMRVEILPSYWFVPKDVGLNADTDRLSVILTAVTASTSASVQALAAPAGPATPLPPSLSLPQGIARADAETSEGIYAGQASNCCFLSDRAAFTVRGTAHARSLVLNVFVPSYSFYKEQRLTVRIDGKVATETGVLRSGAMTAVNVPILAAGGSPDSLRVEISPSYSFVPEDAGLNGDTRRLSVILTSVIVGASTAAASSPAAKRESAAPVGRATPLPTSLSLPPGIDRTDAGTSEGVYADESTNCCFLSGRAIFTVRGTANAHGLTLDVYVPGYSFYGAQRLTVLVDGKVAAKTGVLMKGAMASVNVPLPAKRLTSDSVRVEILPSYSFIPKDVGLNADTRRLSVILKDITVRQ